MAAYGTLVAWAKVMGHTDAADLLEEILEEEKVADEKLTALAEGGINQAAADDADPADGHGDENKPTAKATRKKATSRGKAGSRR